MIRFKELHLKLMSDSFYGYPPQAADDQQHGGDKGASLEDAETVPDDRPTRTRTLATIIYHDLAGFDQARQFQAEFGWKFFKDDIHRELIYLRCSFLGLPAFRNGEPLDWNWRDFIARWDEDFTFKNDELREFLRGQKLPLPAYFFFGEPDTTATIQHLPIKLGSEKDDDKPLTGRERQKAATEKSIKRGRRASTNWQECPRIVESLMRRCAKSLQGNSWERDTAPLTSSERRPHPPNLLNRFPGKFLQANWPIQD